MKRRKFDPPVLSHTRLRLLQILMASLLVCFLITSFETRWDSGDDDELLNDTSFPRAFLLGNSGRPTEGPLRDPRGLPRKMRESKQVSGLVFEKNTAPFEGNVSGVYGLHNAAVEAWRAGRSLYAQIESGKLVLDKSSENRSGSDPCPHSFSLSGSEFHARNRVMVIPCGLTLWSHITVVGTPRWAHPENEPKIAVLKEGAEAVMVSQFMMELQGLKNVEGEDPPRILHFNPRLKGDWSNKPVIEQNTCYRMQWGSPLRCEGWRSRPDQDTVDGQVKCEKWIRDDDDRSEEWKAIWWLNRLIGRTKKVTIDWPYPFAEGRMFVLTVSAGLEGYHISVDGRHVTSFPYRTGFVLEDATGLFVNGDVDVHSIFAASLPTSHPSFAPQMHLEMDTKWKAPPSLPYGHVELFIGILSAGNHFAERMAVRKSWMQHKLVKSSHIVARFFVALHGRKEVNVELMKEVEYFGDIVIVPYMDNYDLVVLKTIAICEYGVRAVPAKYIMKCDDDTFVRVDAVLKEVRKVRKHRSLYIGNLNYHHKPLRYGKWAVTYEGTLYETILELRMARRRLSDLCKWPRIIFFWPFLELAKEWPEEDYPTYANGPGYIVSSDVAKFILSEFEKNKLRLFKMEDVSMGMWVEQFNNSRPVKYVHSLKFCQHGCIEDYYTAHYQSPRQMICMWGKLQHNGKPQCCNMR